MDELTNRPVITVLAFCIVPKFNVVLVNVPMVAVVFVILSIDALI